MSEIRVIIRNYLSSPFVRKCGLYFSSEFPAKVLRMIEVVAAVIEFDGKLLAFQRGPAKHEYVANKYEFPGGKVETGENHRLALTRELREELPCNRQE